MHLKVYVCIMQATHSPFQKPLPTQVPTTAPPTHHPGPAPSSMHRSDPTCTNSGADLHMQPRGKRSLGLMQGPDPPARSVGRSVYVGDGWAEMRA